MTKKDYMILAAALKAARATTASMSSQDVRFGIALVERELRKVFVADNPHFNDQNFREAAGAFNQG